MGLKVERKGQSAVSLFGFFPPLHFYFVSNLPLHHHQRRANVPVSERACHFSPITLAQMSLFNNLARGCYKGDKEQLIRAADKRTDTLESHTVKGSSTSV